MVLDEDSATAEVTALRAQVARLKADQAQLLYGLSHDLRSPLRIAQSFTELLSVRCAEQIDQRSKEYLAYTLDSLVQLSKRLNALLTISRLNTVGLVCKSTDIAAVFEGVVNGELASKIRTSEAIVRVEPIGETDVDQSLLHTVATHLVDNALTFRAKDRRPEITIAPEPGTPATLVFSIKDNGMGIPPNQTDAVFGLFRQLHPRGTYPGEGIGLALCKAIVDAHGGSIVLASMLGEYTKVTVALPRRGGPPA